MTRTVEDAAIMFEAMDGRHDYTVPHVLWDGIVDALPDATLQMFEKSGHQPFFEEPDRFAETLARWMMSQEGLAHARSE